MEGLASVVCSVARRERRYLLAGSNVNEADFRYVKINLAPMRIPFDPQRHGGRTLTVCTMHPSVWHSSDEYNPEVRLYLLRLRDTERKREVAAD
jgi:hypothetical protein